MDRYEADWAMVERGFRCHVQGIGRQFPSARAAIEADRAETGCIDQDLREFVIAENGEPVGKIQPGDSVILFNFRGDRALEISRALGDPDFDKFDRGDYHGVKFAGMLEYDGDAHIPARFLVEPPSIENTLTELLVAHGIREYALSETQKYGHVTYFWNGNRSGKISEELETYEEIPSDNCPFDQKPAMKCREITDHLLSAMESRNYWIPPVQLPQRGYGGPYRKLPGCGGIHGGPGPAAGADSGGRGTAGVCAAGDGGPRQRGRDAGEGQKGEYAGAYCSFPFSGALYYGGRTR